MKALVYGAAFERNLPEVKEVPVPEPGRGEVLVRLRAASLNHLDLLVASSKGGWPTTSDPVVTGTDGAGEVAALGEGVTGWQVGDPVLLLAYRFCGQCPACLAGRQSHCKRFDILGTGKVGTFAQYISVPATQLFRKPEHLSFAEAATLPSAYATAWNAIITQGKLQPGETVLLHGIGSGVSLFGLQLAVGLGARAVVTSSSDQKLARAKEMGAFGTINYKREDVAKALKPIVGGPVDLVLEGTGKETLQTSLFVTARTGRVVMYGATTGTGEIPMQYLFAKTLLPGGVGDVSDMAAALRYAIHTGLKPVISHTFDLFTQYEEAYATLAEHRQFGKVVLTID